MSSRFDEYLLPHQNLNVCRAHRAQAVDLALRLARTFTRRHHVLCLAGAYHGVTTATDEVTTTLNDNPTALNSRPKYIHLCPMPNMYRGVHRYVRVQMCSQL